MPFPSRAVKPESLGSGPGDSNRQSSLTPVLYRLILSPVYLLVADWVPGSATKDGEDLATVLLPVGEAKLYPLRVSGWA